MSVNFKSLDKIYQTYKDSLPDFSEYSTEQLEKDLETVHQYLALQEYSRNFSTEEQHLLEKLLLRLKDAISTLEKSALLELNAQKTQKKGWQAYTRSVMQRHID